MTETSSPGRRGRTGHSRVVASRHGGVRAPHPFRLILRVFTAVLAVLLVSGVSIGAIAASKIMSGSKTVALPGETVAPIIAVPNLGAFEGAFNILVVGSDRCEKTGGCKDRQGNLNDVTMLVHVAADQKTAVAVSFPRDLVVPIPSCPKESGNGRYGAMSAQPINNTLGYGGLPCTVLTVEALTGLKIPYAAEITFSGVIAMSTAVGGVPVCVNGPIRDLYSGLILPKAGEYVLSGQDALNFLRTRHGVGDGSDLGRISSQQVFMSSLVRTIKSDKTLTDLPKLFAIATAATTHMTLSNSLASLNTMASMALVLKGIPLENITFVQYPGVTGQGGVYTGKVAPVKSVAAALFKRIAADIPFTLDSGTGLGSVANPNAPVASPAATPAVPPTPAAPSASVAPSASASPSASSNALDGVQGQTAAQYTCSKANN
ncbi:MAG: LCP family protein [Microbacteriaceae bacterium]|nr:LCP family protein [Microbacteriaceae bacterium]